VSGRKKILVTGATGLVGGNLARLLVEEYGEAVRVLVRASSNTMALDDLDIERVEGDITDPESLARAMDGCDRVYHSAALVSMWNGHLEQMRQVNAGGTVKVLEAARDAGVERMVHVSTNGAIGMGSHEAPADETAAFNPEAFGTAYSVTKHEAHQAALAFARESLDVVLVCPTYMFGAWDVKPTSGTLVVESAAGKLKLYPPGGNNIVPVLDVCHGMIGACERGRRGEVYLLANQEGNLGYQAIFELIAQVVGSAPPRGPLPRWLSRMVGAAADGWAHLTGGTPQINSASVSLMNQPQFYTPRKAIEELGMPQTPVRDAIQEAYDWFREHGYIS